MTGGCLWYNVKMVSLTGNCNSRLDKLFNKIDCFLPFDRTFLRDENAFERTLIVRFCAPILIAVHVTFSFYESIVVLLRRMQAEIVCLYL